MRSIGWESLYTQEYSKRESSAPKEEKERKRRGWRVYIVPGEAGEELRRAGGIGWSWKVQLGLLTGTRPTHTHTHMNTSHTDTYTYH